MNVLLVDVDSKDGNLALAKLYNYHLGKDDKVTLNKLGLTGYPSNKFITVDGDGFDRVYASNLFEVNQDKFRIVNCSDIVIGGMGSKNPELQLEAEVYNTQPNQIFSVMVL